MTFSREEKLMIAAGLISYIAAWNGAREESFPGERKQRLDEARAILTKIENDFNGTL